MEKRDWLPISILSENTHVLRVEVESRDWGVAVRRAKGSLTN